MLKDLQKKESELSVKQFKASLPALSYDELLEIKYILLECMEFDKPETFPEFIEKTSYITLELLRRVNDAD